MNEAIWFSVFVGGMIFVVCFVLSCLHEIKTCSYCGLKLGDRYIMKWYRMLWDPSTRKRHKNYFHPWCWDKKYNTLQFPHSNLKSQQSYMDRNYLDIDPRITEREKQNKLKMEWLRDDND